MRSNLNKIENNFIHAVYVKGHAVKSALSFLNLLSERNLNLICSYPCKSDQDIVPISCCEVLTLIIDDDNNDNDDNDNIDDVVDCGDSSDNSSSGGDSSVSNDGK